MKYHLKALRKENEGKGLCCPYCADSKYPCVRMEMTQMGKRREEPKQAGPEQEED